MKKRIVHYLIKPFDTFALCGKDVRDGFSSLDANNVNCISCNSILETWSNIMESELKYNSKLKEVKR